MFIWNKNFDLTSSYNCEDFAVSFGENPFFLRLSVIYRGQVSADKLEKVLIDFFSPPASIHLSIFAAPKGE